MTQEQSGILVNKIYPLADAAKILKKDDVILSIEGSPIGNDGTIDFRDGGERISFRYALLSKFDEDTIQLEFLRSGKVMASSMKVVKPTMLSLVPANQYDVLPSYFIFAGLVFQTLTQPFLQAEWGKEWQQKAPVRFVEKALYAPKEFADQEIVILSQILAADINVTYQQYVPNVITHVNRIPIRNLRHLVELVDSNTEPFLRFDLESERVIILNAKDASTQSGCILEHHNIPNAKSLDLRSPNAAQVARC